MKVYQVIKKNTTNKTARRGYKYGLFRIAMVNRKTAERYIVTNNMQNTHRIISQRLEVHKIKSTAGRGIY